MAIPARTRMGTAEDRVGGAIIRGGLTRASTDRKTHNGWLNSDTNTSFIG